MNYFKKILFVFVSMALLGVPLQSVWAGGSSKNCRGLHCGSGSGMGGGIGREIGEGVGDGIGDGVEDRQPLPRKAFHSKRPGMRRIPNSQTWENFNLLEKIAVSYESGNETPSAKAAHTVLAVVFFPATVGGMLGDAIAEAAGLKDGMGTATMGERTFTAGWGIAWDIAGAIGAPRMVGAYGRGLKGAVIPRLDPISIRLDPRINPGYSARTGNGGGCNGGACRSVVEPKPHVGLDKSPHSPRVKERYNRKKHYGGAQTHSPAAKVVRAAAEGKPCLTCNRTMKSGSDTAPVPEHSPPLVEHFYERGGHEMTPKQRRNYARSPEALDGARCLTCQRRQGGKASHYSRQKAKEFGLEPKK